ncbi:MAG: hypothetical protein AAF569_08360 [Pseudomonadota bacterium]
MSGKLTHDLKRSKDNKNIDKFFGVIVMQSRLGLAHLVVFISCGFLSIAACCLGVFGVMTHNTITQTPYIVQSAQTAKDNAVADFFDSQNTRDMMTHPKNKKWEPVFVLSRNETSTLLEN